LRDGEPNSDAIKAICISRQLADEVDRLRKERAAVMQGYFRMRDEVAAAIRKPPLEGSITEAFDVLREASGGAWDGVDAEAYVRELRDDEGETDSS
jgi:hypothetical protein